MDCSFIDCLTSGKLGELSIGMKRSRVLEILGEPTNCIPNFPRATRDECDIWTYNRLQINFAANLVEELLLVCRFSWSDEAMEMKSFSPLRFIDVNPVAIGELNSFIGFLKERNLSYSEQPRKGWIHSEQQLIRTSPGVVAWFTQKRDAEKSAAVSYIARSGPLYLDMIRAHPPYSSILDIIKEGNSRRFEHAVAWGSPFPKDELSQALFSAVRCGSGYVEALLRLGPDPNYFQDDDWPALHWAVEQEQFRTIRLLLEHGSNVNVRDRAGWTPLHRAVDVEARLALQLNRPPSSARTRFLLQFGADPTIKDNKGKTPLDIAKDYKHEKAISLLEQAIVSE